MRGGGGTILLGENNVGRAAKHLVLCIAEEAFIPYIPACDQAVGIHTKDGEINGTLDKKLEQLLLIGHCKWLAKHARPQYSVRNL
jgi:hypothetical protein